MTIIMGQGAYAVTLGGLQLIGGRDVLARVAAIAIVLITIKNKN